jgi:Leucine-rich repeat (LRR) protein
MFKRLREILIFLVLAYVALYFLNSEITDTINAQILALFKPKTESTVTENELVEAKVYTSLEDANKEADKVVKLDLSGQNLAAIPQEVFQMKRLQFLDLSKNKITEIPDGIQSLSQLQELHLYDNQLNKVSSKIDELAFLQKLNLAKNQLTTLPDVMSNLGKLANLDLSENAGLDFKKVLNDLGYSRSLKKLTLKSNSSAVQGEISKLRKLLPELEID